MNQRPQVLLSFDIEEFDLPEEYGQRISEEDKLSIPVLGTRRILDVLKSQGVPATFFVTAYFADRAPELVHRMAQEGHEVASHGLNHTQFAPSHLLESRRVLESHCQCPVIGFRMARLAKVEKSDILAAGYRYESSLNPVWLPGRYNNLGKPCVPFQESCGLWQYPVSAVPGIRFPLFWLSYKNLPLWLYTFLSGIAMKRTGFFNMYSHPWEYNERCRDPQWQIPRYITRYAGVPYAQRLEQLIAWLKPRGTFTTFASHLTHA